MRRVSLLLAVSCGVLAGATVLAASPALAQQNATQGTANQSLSGMKLSGDKPIQIESDKLEVQDKDNTAVFSGNVNVVQGTTVLKSGRMVVHYIKGSGGAVPGGSGNIKSIEVSGKVYVKSDEQIATGDHGTFDMQSQVLVLEGDKVVLTQGDNVIMGCKLTANLKTGLSNLDGCSGASAKGRVKVLLTPDKKKAAQ